MANYRRSEFHCAFAMVYALTDLNDNIFYVGVTITPIEFRLYTHIAEARSGSEAGRKYNKIRELNLMIKAKELDRIWVTGKSRKSLTVKGMTLERSWINKLKKEGIPLLNGREYTN